MCVCVFVVVVVAFEFEEHILARMILFALYDIDKVLTSFVSKYLAFSNE